MIAYLRRRVREYLSGWADVGRNIALFWRTPGMPPGHSAWTMALGWTLAPAAYFVFLYTMDPRFFAVRLWSSRAAGVAAALTGLAYAALVAYPLACGLTGRQPRFYRAQLLGTLTFLSVVIGWSAYYMYIRR